MNPSAAPKSGAPAKGSAAEPRKPMHDDEQKVKAFIVDRVQADVRANTARRTRDRADLEGLMFHRGGEDNQWTVWDPSTNSYVPRPADDKDESALPGWFFRATSNLFGVKIDGICSILNQSQPAQEVGPEHDNDRDRATAEIAEAALPVLYEESGYRALRSIIHKLIALTNGCAVHVYYDTDERWGMDDMPILQCRNPDCQQYHMPHDVQEGEPCPECGTEDQPADPTTGAPGQPAVDWAMNPQTNMPLSQKFPRGKVCLRLLTSFEFSLPRSAREYDEERVGWIASHGRMDPVEIVALWAKAKGHVENSAAKSPAGTKTGGTQSAIYADTMRGMSGPGGAADKVGASMAPAGPVVWMVWADPVDDDDYYFPEGLYAVMLDEEFICESGPLPFKDDKGRPVKNVLLRTFQATPGAAWGHPPGDDLVPLQKQLNLCQALAFLILMNDAAGTTYIPDTVTLLQDLTGRPGATVQFKSLRPGDKPFVEHGTGFPDSLKWFLEYLVNQFDTVSKLNAVLMGARPAGDPTLGEVQILKEQGLSAFKEPLDQLVDFEKRLSRMLLWVARQTMWSPRFYTVAGDNGEWDVKQFLGADLDGNVSINVEPSSAWPASQLLQNLRLNQAMDHGIINGQDPEVQAKYLSLNDLTDFKQTTDVDRKQVARQIDAWKKAVSPQEIRPPDKLWNLNLHFFLKVNWLRTEEAEKIEATNPAVFQAIHQHVEQIQMLMAPPPAPAPGPPGPPTGEAVGHAVQAGAIRPVPPGGRKPDGRALNAAVASKAIHPAGTHDAMAAHAAMKGHGGPSLNTMLSKISKPGKKGGRSQGAPA